MNDAGVPLTLRNLLFKPGTKCGIIRCKAQYAGLVHKSCKLFPSIFERKLYLMKNFSPLTKNMHCKCDDFGCRWIRNGVRNNLRRGCGHIQPSGDVKFDHHKSELTPEYL